MSFNLMTRLIKMRDFIPITVMMHAKKKSTHGENCHARFHLIKVKSWHGQKGKSDKTFIIQMQLVHTQKKLWQRHVVAKLIEYFKSSL